MKMQNSDWMEIFHSWWRGDTPIGAALLAIIAAGLRIAYTGGGWRQMVLEGPLCGVLTLTVTSSLEYLDLPQSLSITIGGGIGFIGVEGFRAIVLRALRARSGGRDGDQ